jgi:DNA-directed RNA polymerase subunit RPC12/RpoP
MHAEAAYACFGCGAVVHVRCLAPDRDGQGKRGIRCERCVAASDAMGTFASTAPTGDQRGPEVVDVMGVCEPPISNVQVFTL